MAICLHKSDALYFRHELYILSRASGVGSPTNHPGLRAATRHGASDPYPTIEKEEWTVRTLDPFY